jgi:hypothetical protein
LLLLLWVGLDLGVHGLFPSDFHPIAVTVRSADGAAVSGSAAADRSHDHCFCRSVSPVATPLPLAARRGPTGIFVSIVPSKVLFSAERPQDRPPKALA